MKHDVATPSSVAGFRNPFNLRMLVEFVVLLIVMLYVRRQCASLRTRIRELEMVVESQRTVLESHHRILRSMGVVRAEDVVSTPSSSSPTMPPTTMLPSLETIETIATIFNVGMGGGGGDPPAPNPHMTIIEKPSSPPVETTKTIEEELASEMQELANEEQNRQSLPPEPVVVEDTDEKTV